MTPIHNLLIRSPKSSGWTQFTESVDTRKVYVSDSTGNDTNNGLSTGTPKKTIAAGKALMRNGYPDWLLLKTGDTWTESLGQWIASGRSATERMLISSYGSASQRPFLRTGNGDGITAIFAGASPASIDYVAITGLHFRAHTYTGSGEPSGIAWLIESTYLLVEDCLIEGYQIDVSVPGFGGHKRDIKVRRNVIVDAFATSGTVGHGIYMANCDGVLIEENILDHNGWSETIPGAIPTVFRHGIYIQSGSGTCTDVIVRKNIIANSSSHGLQLRPGGVAEDNLFLKNSIALLLGGGNEPNPGGVTVNCRRNVILEGKNIDASNLRGWGIEVENIASGILSENVIAHRMQGDFPLPVDVHGTGNGIGVFNLLISGNIISDWGGVFDFQGDNTQLGSITLSGNDLQNTITSTPLLEHGNASSTAVVTSSNNRFFSASASANAWFQVVGTTYSLSGWKALVGDTSSTATQPNYIDSSRTIATYMVTVGGSASLDGFLAQARLQSKAYWRNAFTAQAVNAYIRKGFTV